MGDNSEVIKINVDVEPMNGITLHNTTSLLTYISGKIWDKKMSFEHCPPSINFEY